MQSDEKKTGLLVIIKPGFTDYRLVEQIFYFLAERGVILILKDGERPLPHEFLKELYKEHEGKHFYEEHMKYMNSGPCRIGTALVDSDKYPDEDPTAVLDGLVRSKIKASVRSMFGKSIRENVMHCSDTPESMETEYKLAKQYQLI